MNKNVTVLIPAFNEELFIEKAVLSAVSQAEFVIISDNKSTDRTVEICRELVKKYDNLQLLEQIRNIGAAKNYEILLEQVKTEYLIFMGAHDILADNYVSELMDCYLKNPKAALIYAPTIKIDDNGDAFDEYMISDIAEGVASEDPFKRVFTLIKDLSDCSIVFGLFRTELYRKNIFLEPIAGLDKVFLCNIARDGFFVRCNLTRFYRRYVNRENSKYDYMKRIIGNTEVGVKFDLSRMCEEQLKCIKSVKTVNFLKKTFYRHIAKKALKERYGFN
jgi:glycosyltransferase involved in cell wall biosynthesis